MNSSKKTIALGAALLGLTHGTGLSATIVQTAANGDWNAASSWGGTAPASGNDYVLNPLVGTGGTAGLLRSPSGQANSVFLGGSLKVPTGTTLLMKTQTSVTNPEPNFAQVNGPITFDGGLLNLGPNAATNASMIATQFIVTANGATFQSGFSGRNLTLEGTLTGVGPISIIGDGGTRVVTFTNILSYTGDITVSQNMGLAFGISYVFTGGLNLSTVASTLKVNTGQTLTFTQGELVDFVNGAVPAGTYTGPDLTALGANYTNNGGTLIVVVPEPSVALLGALGVLGLLRRRRN